MAAINQNLTQYSSNSFDPIPPGEYEMIVNDSQVTDTKTGKRMIKLSCKVVSGHHAGRIVFDNFVLGNDVAMSRLKTLATVGGHPRPDYIQDTEELHGLRFIGNVGIRESEGYAPQNNIKTFKKIPAPNGAPQPGTFPPAPPMAHPNPVPQVNPAPFPAVPPAPQFPQAQALPPAPPAPPMAPPPMQPSLGGGNGSGKPPAPWMK